MPSDNVINSEQDRADEAWESVLEDAGVLEYRPVDFSWHINTEGFPSGALKILDVVSRPRFGWNPLRWIFRRPKYWDVEIKLEGK